MTSMPITQFPFREVMGISHQTISDPCQDIFFFFLPLVSCKLIHFHYTLSGTSEQDIVSYLMLQRLL